MIPKLHLPLLPIVLMIVAPVAPAVAPIADTPFVQEYHERYPVRLGTGDEIDDLRSIAVSRDGVYIAAAKGAYVLKDSHWAAVPGAALGSTYSIEVDASNTAWIGGWDGLRYLRDGATHQIAEIHGPITAIAFDDDAVIAMGPDGMWVGRGGKWKSIVKPWARSIRGIAIARDHAVWMATAHGVFVYRDGNIVKHFFDELPFAELSAIAVAPDGTVWSAGFGGLTAFDGLSPTQRFDYQSKLPSLEIQTVAVASDGTVWTGSKLGCARWNGTRWSVRHSQRWLLDDDVRDIAFDAEGNAWIATRKGVSAIKRRSITLEAKAAELMAAVEARHIRPPGLVEKCVLQRPGDLASWKPCDTDNDGQYTSMYLAMQSLRYAVTKDPGALSRAREAFHGVAFLHEVTGVKGFLARSVIPIEWTVRADPNRTLTPEQIADERVENPRWKYVEQRWRPSKDGKWMWKGDTSSDEVVGHLFGLYYFYKLAANEEEKQQAKQLILDTVDYIVDGGYVLRDIDGTHTKWGAWSPDLLNDDPDWRSEAPLNKLEMIAFLSFAHELSGDAQYLRQIKKLVGKYGYASSAARPKPTAPSEQTHIDSFLLALIYPWFLDSISDTALRAKYDEGHEYWYGVIKHDDNPFFTYAYAIHGTQAIDNAACVGFLRAAPLDLIEWTVDNSARGDLELVHTPELWPPQMRPLPPPSERGVIRWDGNPFSVVRGSGARTESSGVYWLLPYWMGRYYGYIAAP